MMAGHASDLAGMKMLAAKCNIRYRAGTPQNNAKGKTTIFYQI